MGVWMHQHVAASISKEHDKGGGERHTFDSEPAGHAAAVFAAVTAEVWLRSCAASDVLGRGE